MFVERFQQDVPNESPGEREVVAWELVDVGRYQPRRIRGSCVGRALG